MLIDEGPMAGVPALVLSVGGDGEAIVKNDRREWGWRKCEILIYM